MTDHDTPDSTPNQPSEHKPYVAPEVVEEEVFEREALLAACRYAFQCGFPYETVS